MDWISIVKEDVKVFQLVFGQGIGKYFYYPAFRVVLLFRLSQLCYRYILLRPFAYMLTNLNDFFHGIWIGPKVQVGKGFLLSHPRGIIVHPDTVIGDYCSMLHQVTLGGERIVIGDNVEILAGAKIINDKLHGKDLYIGGSSVIAAGAIVLKSCPKQSVLVGMPAKVVKYREDGDTWINYRLREMGKG